MTSAEIVPIAAAILVPVVTAVLGALGIALQDWRHRKSEMGRRRLAFEDAGRQVAFATNWWSAQKLMVDSTDELRDATDLASGWLKEASALVVKSVQLPIEDSPSLTISRLLLFYPLRGRMANLFRIAFYISLAAVVMQFGATISHILTTDERERVGGDTWTLSVLALLSLSLRLLVGLTEDREADSEKAARVTIRRWLLFYRLNGAAAHVVRIALYILLAVTVGMAWAFAIEARDNLSDIPVMLFQIVALTGLAVALRYWAADLGRSSENREEADPLPTGNHDAGDVRRIRGAVSAPEE